MISQEAISSTKSNDKLRSATKKIALFAGVNTGYYEADMNLEMIK